MNAKMKSIAIITSFCLITPLLADKKSIKLESLVVTAQKVEENVQDLALSANLLNELDIKDYSIKQTKDIFTYIPNFASYHAGSRDYWTRIVMRGITNTAIGDPSSALYIDGVSYTNLYAFNQTIDDIERIEVLKGPQGTLYGKNTEAGVINIITKSPTNELGGKISLNAGSFKEKGVNALVNAPLIKDRLFLRFSALKSKKNGFIKNIAKDEKMGDEDTFASKANLKLQANERLKFNLILGYSKFKDKGGYPMVPADKELYKKATGLKNIDKFEIANDFSGESNSKYKHINLKTTYDFNNYNFTSVTSYRDGENDGTLDGDFTPAPIFIGFNENKSKTFEQELRLNSKESSDIRWIAGVYFSNDEQELDTGYRFDKLAAKQYKMPIFTEDRMSADVSSKDFAVFGQSTIRFFDEKLGATLGLRAEKSKRQMKNRTHKTGGINIVAPIRKLSKTDDILLPKFGLDYKFNDDLMAYLTLSRGYKAGGFSFAVDDVRYTEFEPEFSTQVELGVKSSFKNLILNAAVFYTKVDDYQDRLQVNPMLVLQANVSKVDIKGLELEALYNINQNLSLKGSFGYTDAKYGDYYDDFAKKNYKGNKVAVVPEYDLNLDLKYTNTLGVFASFSMQTLGSKFADRENQYKLGTATTFNTKVGYERENWDIFLGIKNIFDKEVFLDGFNAGETGYLVTTGARRAVGLEFNFRF